MIVTKRYCDFCGNDVGGDWFNLTANLEKMPRGDGMCGYKDRDFKGEFCGRKCASKFIESDGKKQEPLPQVEAAQ